MACPLQQHRPYCFQTATVQSVLLIWKCQLPHGDKPFHPRDINNNLSIWRRECSWSRTSFIFTSLVFNIWSSSQGLGACPDTEIVPPYSLPQSSGTWLLWVSALTLYSYSSWWPLLHRYWCCKICFFVTSQYYVTLTKSRKNLAFKPNWNHRDDNLKVLIWQITATSQEKNQAVNKFCHQHQLHCNLRVGINCDLPKVYS